jgi:uncharacterized protein YjbI with pentapeptide repeats
MTKMPRQQSSKFEPFTLDVRGAYLRRTDLSFANLQRANLSQADFANASFRGADFKDAVLDETILRGADLTGAKNLTLAQLTRAIIDETTKLPENFSIEEIVRNRQSVA